MNTALAIFAGVYFYVMAVIAVQAFTKHFHDAVWWPLTLVKFLWRTLYRALTEGWRP